MAQVQVSFEGFLPGSNLKFDISKLRNDLEKVLEKKDLNLLA